jgi:hypothetical protein
VTEASEWPSGSHRRRGVLVAAGGRTRTGALEERQIADIPATALAFCGIGWTGLDGTPIEEIAGTDQTRAAAGQAAPAPMPVAAPAGDVSDAEHDYVAQHLRDLGYIE